MTAATDQSLNFDTRFPVAHGQPLATARLKSVPADFVVEETLSFPLNGQGEHLYLRIRKTNANTEWVSKQLARQLAIPVRDIGYAGLKDRHAVTTQWFSLPAAGLRHDKLDALQIEGVEVIERVSHERKLRRGAIRQNHFTLRLRDVWVEPDTLHQRLARITEHGVPNYFDEQRFGHQRGNLPAALEMFARRQRPARHRRGIYLSAARAWLFNQILAQRVAGQCWYTALEGDVYQLDGSKRYFVPELLDSVIHSRLAQGDIHPTAALWGRGPLASYGTVASLEQEQALHWAGLAEGLTAAGLEQDRRACRVIPRDLGHDYDVASGTLVLVFGLPPGSYATAILRELFTPITGPESNQP